MTLASPRETLAGSIAQIDMVELDEVTSNQLFQTLADWNEQLKGFEDVIRSDEFGGPQP